MANNDEHIVLHSSTDEEADLLGEYTEARITNKLEAPIMGTNYNYRVVGHDTFMSDQRSINASRRVTSTEPENEEMLVEEKRIRTASSLKEARILADIKEPEKAREKLVDGGTSFSKKDASTSLSEIDAILAKTPPCELLLFTEPQEFYVNQGRASAVALESSHETRRATALPAGVAFAVSLMFIFFVFLVLC